MKIAIFGTVGVGKSTISQRLAKELGYKVFPEPIAHNPYFKDYYRDLKNNIFKMQIYMLTARSLQLTKAKNLDNVIFDRTILEDPIFVKVNHDLGTMNDTDYETYNNFFQHVVLPSLGNRLNVDLVIYLKVSTAKAIERIKHRGRKEEALVDEHYWELLNRYYEEFYRQHKKDLNFVIIDAETDNLDEKIEEIKTKIKALEAAKKNKNSRF